MTMFRDKLPSELVAPRDQVVDEPSRDAGDETQTMWWHAEGRQPSSEGSTDDPPRLAAQIDGLGGAITTLGLIALAATTYLTLRLNNNWAPAIAGSGVVLLMGIGLGRRWRGARVGMLVLATLALPAFPFGTMIGLCLWRLLRDRDQYERSVRQAATW